MAARWLFVTLLVCFAVHQLSASDPVRSFVICSICYHFYSRTRFLKGWRILFCNDGRVRILLQLFTESFDEAFEGRWIVSEKDDYKGIFFPFLCLDLIFTRILCYENGFTAEISTYVEFNKEC